MSQDPNEILERAIPERRRTVLTAYLWFLLQQNRLAAMATPEDQPALIAWCNRLLDSGAEPRLADRRRVRDGAGRRRFWMARDTAAGSSFRPESVAALSVVLVQRQTAGRLRAAGAIPGGRTRGALPSSSTAPQISHRKAVCGGESSRRSRLGSRARRGRARNWSSPLRRPDSLNPRARGLEFFPVLDLRLRRHLARYAGGPADLAVRLSYSALPRACLGTHPARLDRAIYRFQTWTSVLTWRTLAAFLAARPVLRPPARDGFRPGQLAASLPAIRGLRRRQLRQPGPQRLGAVGRGRRGRVSLPAAPRFGSMVLRSARCAGRLPDEDAMRRPIRAWASPPARTRP